MCNPRRVISALILAAWATMALACGGVGGNGLRTKATSKSSGSNETHKASGGRESGVSAEAPVGWRGKLGAGRVGTGASAYDELPEPWRSRFRNEWSKEVEERGRTVTKAEGSLEQAQAVAKKARDELARFEARNKGDLGDSLIQVMHKSRKADVAAAEALVRGTESALTAARENRMAAEQNSPAYFQDAFEGCATARDIEDRLDALDAQKRAEDMRRSEAEQRRREEEEKRREREEYDSDGLVLLVTTVRGGRTDFGGEVTGTVVNRRGKALRYAQITFNLYDESGSRVGTAVANITGLEAGSRWTFRASSFGTKFRTYKLSELSGF